eukprot:IDg3815t1
MPGDRSKTASAPDVHATTPPDARMATPSDVRMATLPDAFAAPLPLADVRTGTSLEVFAAPGKDAQPMGEGGRELSWTSHHQAFVLKPFMRRMDWHMDSCAATNKSRFVMAGIGLIVSSAVFDSIRALFMVPGHTKFGPDLVARAIAGMYNSSDVYNPYMLIECIENYGAGKIYDERGLLHWKLAVEGLFGAVDSITKYSYFYIVADDGISGVAERSLRVIVKLALSNKLKGGVGGRADVGAAERLMSEKVLKARRVRLFMSRTLDEPVVREQEGWLLVPSTADVTDAINASLATLVPYSTTPDVGKEFYGLKRKASWTRGQAQGLRPTVKRRQLSILEYAVDSAAASGASALAPTSNKMRTHRWKMTRDAAALLKIIDEDFEGVVPRSSAAVRHLAELMPVTETGCVWDGSKLRRRAMELQRDQNRSTS